MAAETHITSGKGVLRSATIGTSASDLIAPCKAPWLPGRTPESSPGREPLAVTLSGGGFRATLAALGVLRFLADTGLLADVRYVSSVSGGSVANGLLATAMPTLRAGGFGRDVFDVNVLVPFVERTSTDSLTGRLLRRAWKIIGPGTRTDLLADQFDEVYFHGLQLADLDPSWRFVFNATNTATGVRFGFERDVVGDYVIGRLPTAGTGLRLAVAVAASAAVPGMLAPLVLTGLPEFPCQHGRPVRLSDGGALDNLGSEAIDELRSVFMVGVNAGGLFVTGRYGKIPLVRDLQLAESSLYRQTTALRLRVMVERFQAYEAIEDRETGLLDGPAPDWGRHGVVFGLGTTIPDDPRAAGWRAANPVEPDPQRVALVPTTFGRLDRSLCHDLVYAGWWLAGATVTMFHPHLLPDPKDPPRWVAPW
jgi:NTE family protein